MNGAFHAPPLTAPPAFADGQSRRESPKMAFPPISNLREEMLQNQKESGQALWGIGRLVHPFSGAAGGGQGRV